MQKVLLRQICTIAKFIHKLPVAPIVGFAICSTLSIINTKQKLKNFSTNVELNKRTFDETKKIIIDLESRIQLDEGKRGIKEIIVHNDQLYNAANELLKSRNKKVAIITGFPCMLDFVPPTETDGPLGALVIARAALAVGKQVVIIVDECNEECMIAAAAASGLMQKYGESFSLESFPGGNDFDIKDEHRLMALTEDIDLLVYIERAGPCHDGSYHTMSKRDMTHILAPLESMLLMKNGIIHETPQIRSIGIGDGGNEVGMGKVYNEIINSHIKNAEEIACVVPCDNLIVSSVSNWGGYSLAAAIAVLSCPMSDSGRIGSKGISTFSCVDEALTACLPSNEEETSICTRLVESGM
jgi:hypothetical protein